METNNEVLLRSAKENLKMNARKICGKLKVCQERRRLRLNAELKIQAKAVVLKNDRNSFEKNTIPSKEEQSIKTLKWLEENFTRCPDVCLPRCIMYEYYLTFCQKNAFRPACAATFGKIIRQKFPELTTRRLGTRGNSKYHYYGVAIKESSSYYHTVYSGRGLTRFSGRKLVNEGDASTVVISSTKSGTLLPEFPSPSQLSLPPHVELCKMDTFMIMYRTHCQCILDTAVTKNYEGVQEYLVHFWHGIPNHLKSLFEVEEIVNLVCICDSIMFMVLNDILVPINLEEITDASLKEVRGFVGSFEGWIQHGLKDCNKNLLNKKIQVARRFVQTVQRQISFLHLAKSFREVLGDKTIASNLVNELDMVDIKSIGAQAVYTTVDCTKDQIELHEQYLTQLKELLRDESAPVEAYVKWLENIFTTQVLQHHEKDYVSFKLRAQEFLLSWSFFGTRVMHMLTLNNSRTYGPFHLVRMMLDEYLLLITETKFSKQEQMELQKLSEKLIKGTTEENGLKVSKVITKSKFGAPKHKLPSSNPTVVDLTKAVVNHTRKTQSLPSISTLQMLSSTKNFKIGMGNINILPNDSFNQRYGKTLDPSMRSVISLTPPSSPPADEKLELEKRSTDRVETVTENVENLVDEHFRNCGYDNVVRSKSSNQEMINNTDQNEFSSFIQKFLKSQNQTMDPYEVSDDVFLHSNQSDDEDEESPLQSSFSQILKGSDLLFSDQLLAESTSHIMNTFENGAKNKDTLLFSNFVNNTLGGDNLYERAPSSLLGDEDDDDAFSTIDTKSLQMPF